jgi:hypothetical protein
LCYTHGRSASPAPEMDSLAFVLLFAWRKGILGLISKSLDLWGRSPFLSGPQSIHQNHKSPAWQVTNRFMKTCPLTHAPLDRSIRRSLVQRKDVRFAFVRVHAARADVARVSAFRGDLPGPWM